MTMETYGLNVPIESTGASKVASELDRVIASLGGAEKAIKGFSNEQSHAADQLKHFGNVAQDTKPKFDHLSNAMTVFKGALGALGIQFGIQQLMALGRTAVDTAISFGKFASSSADSFEGMTISLEGLRGSLAEAQRSAKWIEDMAIAWPVELKDVQEHFNTLVAFGLEPMDGTLRSLIDTASLTSGGMKSMSTFVMQLGQAYTRGKLQAQDANLIMAQGIPVWETMGTVMGVTATKAKEMSEKGLIGQRAIKAMIAELGAERFGEAHRQMETLTGRVSNLNDEWTKVARQFGEGLNVGVKDVLEDLTLVIRDLQESGALRELGKDVGAAATSLTEFAIGAREAAAGFEKLQQQGQIGKDWQKLAIGGPLTPVFAVHSKLIGAFYDFLREKGQEHVEQLEEETDAEKEAAEEAAKAAQRRVADLEAMAARREGIFSRWEKEAEDWAEAEKKAAEKAAAALKKYNEEVVKAKEEAELFREVSAAEGAIDFADMVNQYRGQLEGLDFEIIDTEEAKADFDDLVEHYRGKLEGLDIKLPTKFATEFGSIVSDTMMTLFQGDGADALLDAWQNFVTNQASMLFEALSKSISDSFEDGEFSLDSFSESGGWKQAGMALGSAAGQMMMAYGVQHQNQGVGIAGGALSGAMAGLTMTGGNPWGALVGGIVGAIQGYLSTQQLESPESSYSLGPGGATLSTRGGQGVGPELNEQWRRNAEDLYRDYLLTFGQVLREFGDENLWSLLADELPRVAGEWVNLSADNLMRYLADMELPDVMGDYFHGAISQGLENLGMSFEAIQSMWTVLEDMPGADRAQALLDIVRAVRSASEMIQEMPFGMLEYEAGQTSHGGFLEGMRDYQEAIDSLMGGWDQMDIVARAQAAGEIEGLISEARQMEVQYLRQIRAAQEQINLSVFQQIEGLQLGGMTAAQQGAYGRERLGALMGDLAGAASVEDIQRIMAEIQRYVALIASAAGDSLYGTTTGDPRTIIRSLGEMVGSLDLTYLQALLDQDPASAFEEQVGSYLMAIRELSTGFADMDFLGQQATLEEIGALVDQVRQAELEYLREIADTRESITAGIGGQIDELRYGGMTGSQQTSDLLSRYGTLMGGLRGATSAGEVSSITAELQSIVSALTDMAGGALYGWNPGEELGAARGRLGLGSILEELTMTGRDVFREMMDAIQADVESITSAWDDMSLGEQVDAMAQIAQLTEEARSTELQFLQHIRQVADSVNASIESMLEDIRLGGMEPEEQLGYAAQQIQDLYTQLQGTTDVDAAAALVQQIQQYAGMIRGGMGEDLYTRTSTGQTWADWLTSILESTQGTFGGITAGNEAGAETRLQTIDDLLDGLAGTLEATATAFSPDAVSDWLIQLLEDVQAASVGQLDALAEDAQGTVQEVIDLLAGLRDALQDTLGHTPYSTVGTTTDGEGTSQTVAEWLQDMLQQAADLTAGRFTALESDIEAANDILIDELMRLAGYLGIVNAGFESLPPGVGVSTNPYVYSTGGEDVTVPGGGGPPRPPGLGYGKPIPVREWDYPGPDDWAAGGDDENYWLTDKSGTNAQVVNLLRQILAAQNQNRTVINISGLRGALEQLIRVEVRNALDARQPAQYALY